MRVVTALCVVIVALLGLVAAAGAATKHSAIGRLSGRTELDVGCPAVTPHGGCRPWHLYPHASFTVTRLNSTGAAANGTTTTIESDADARFRVKLHPGSYLLTPTPAKGTKGGSSFRVRVKAHSTETTTVRFAPTVPVV